MLQRIQSVFLFLASGAIFSLLSPMMNFMTLVHGVPNTGSPYSDSIFNINDDKLLMSLAGVGAVGFLIAIFLYKSRKNQALLATLCNFIVGATLIYGLWEARETFASTVKPETASASNIALQSNYGFAIPMLIVAMILSWLAVRFIRRDEKLVRSADRLR